MEYGVWSSRWRPRPNLLTKKKIVTCINVQKNRIEDVRMYIRTCTCRDDIHRIDNQSLYKLAVAQNYLLTN